MPFAVRAALKRLARQYGAQSTEPGQSTLMRRQSEARTCGNQRGPWSPTKCVSTKCIHSGFVAISERVRMYNQTITSRQSQVAQSRFLHSVIALDDNEIASAVNRSKQWWRLVPPGGKLRRLAAKFPWLRRTTADSKISGSPARGTNNKGDM